MHIELIDVLRCPEAHAESSLVLTADRWDGRHVVVGKLGCPVCRSAYPIRDGLADFSGVTAGHAREAGNTHARDAEPGAELRLAAQLDLREPGAIVILCGAHARHAGRLSDLVQARCLVVNAQGAAPGAGGGSLEIGAALPVARGKLWAAALDSAHVGLLGEVEAALRPGARVVAPADAPVPEYWIVIARDEREWVAVVPGGSPLVSLARGLS